MPYINLRDAIDPAWDPSIFGVSPTGQQTYPVSALFDLSCPNPFSVAPNSTGGKELIVAVTINPPAGADLAVFNAAAITTINTWIANKLPSLESRKQASLVFYLEVVLPQITLGMDIAYGATANGDFLLPSRMTQVATVSSPVRPYFVARDRLTTLTVQSNVLATGTIFRLFGITARSST